MDIKGTTKVYMEYFDNIFFIFQITRIFTCYKEYLPVTNPAAQNKTRMEHFIVIELMFSRNPCVW